MKEDKGWLISLLLWIKSSFEDNEGNASHRKLTVFYFCMLVGVMIILTYLSGDPSLFPEAVWLSVIAGALGMSYIRKLSQNNGKQD